MKISLKSLVGGALRVLLGLIVAAGLSVPLISAGAGVSENGFSLMSLNSLYFFAHSSGDEHKLIIVIIGVLCVFQFAVGMMAAVVGALDIFFPKVRRYANGLAIASAVFSVLYMVEGIVYTNVFIQAALVARVYTLSYLPCIFSLLTVAAYFACHFVVQDTVLWGKDRAVKEQNGAEERTAENGAREDIRTDALADAKDDEERKLRYLGEYVRLLKEGAITQQEYEEAKRRIFQDDKDEEAEQ